MRTKHTNRTGLRNALGLTATLAALALPMLGAKADPGDYAFYDTATFGYKINNMPSIDQRRASAYGILGLPNNGAMYCVPTALMNTLGYIANHGYSNVFPGPGNWQANDFGQYNTMSGDLLLFGILMGTDPLKGTGGSGPQTATQQMLNPSQFVVDSIFASKNYSPVLTDLALMAIQGRLVAPSMGWYSNADIPLPHVRKGGHAVTMSEAYSPLLFGNGLQQIGLRDPATDQSLYSQSPFVTNTWSTADILGSFSGNIRTQSRVVGYKSGYLDGATVIKPKVAFTSMDAGFNFLSPIILFNAENQQTTHSYRTPDGERVADMTLDPIAINSPYIMVGQDGVYEIDHLTGKTEMLPDTQYGETGRPLPTSPLKIELGGPDRQLFVLQSRLLTRLSRKGKLEKATPLRQPLVAIRYNAKLNQLFGYAQDGTLYFYNIDLQLLGSAQLPAFGQSRSVDMPSNVHMADDPLTGDMWFLADGSVFVYDVQFREGRVAFVNKVGLRGAISPMALDLDEAGALFVSDQGKINAYDKSGRLLERNPFSGLPGGAMLHIVRSFTNFDPAQHTGPGWDNVLPEDAVR